MMFPLLPSFHFLIKLHDGVSLFLRLVKVASIKPKVKVASKKREVRIHSFLLFTHAGLSISSDHQVFLAFFFYLCICERVILFLFFRCVVLALSYFLLLDHHFLRVSWRAIIYLSSTSDINKSIDV